MFYISVYSAQDMAKAKEEIDNLKTQVRNLQDANKTLGFGVEEVKKTDTFSYYTGFSYLTFVSLLNFLCPPNFKMVYEVGRKEAASMQYDNCLLLTLCRLRHNFGLKDLSIRFRITLQTTGVVFNSWLDHLYFKFGQISIWPHRDKIISNMPSDYKKHFPNTLVIIDATELKTESPAALGLQSQLYSSYKSHTTLKALVGCDPNGALMFVSTLYTGSISDKKLTEDSGFYKLLQELKQNGYILDGDGVMADKGFTIHEELNKLDMVLNIPPFCTTGQQMSSGDVNLTQKIARHRIHVERFISKVKTHSILSNVIPTSVFKKVNEIWTVCCFLTLFQGGYLKSGPDSVVSE